MILTNCRLIPDLCEGFQAEMADIRLEGDRIAEILPAGGGYTGEVVIDCTGKTVLPGLSQLHVHLDMRTHDAQYVLMHKDPMQYMINDITYMQTLLAYGFTSVRDSGGPYGAALRLRDAVAAGEIVGPDIKAPGYILTPDMDYGSYVATGNHSYTHGRGINNPDQARAEARRHIAEGADYLKLLGSAIRYDARRGTGPLFYWDELVELAKVAKEEKTYLGIHTTGPESNAAAIKIEAHTIEHALNMDQKNLDDLEAHGLKSNIVMTASVCVYPGCGDTWRTSNVAIKTASEMGVRIGFGTDLNMTRFLADPAQEWRLRREIGFNSLEILKQATIDSAIINGTDKELGTIKVGKRADFAIVDGKPDENFEVFGKPCAYVLKAGKVVARSGMILCMAAN